MKRVLDGEAVRVDFVGGDDVEVVGGLGGREEEGEEGGGGGGEGGADEADVEGEREGEREERGDEGVRGVGERGRMGKGVSEGGGEREEGVVGGLTVKAGLVGQKGVEAKDWGGAGGGYGGS